MVLTLECGSRGRLLRDPPCPKQPKPNGTPGKKPPAPSVKLRLGWTPLQQRIGNEKLEPSAQRRSRHV